MKKILTLSCSILVVLCISCKKQNTGVFPPIKFKPEKITLNQSNDTIKVKADRWLNIVYGTDYPMNEDGSLDKITRSNKTEDTLTAGWMKAVALNNEEKREFIMKVITLEKNDTGKERSYVIRVGHGPSFGHLIVTQPAK